MCQGNMNKNYWESSSRSLFVKTIWEGDHRHVILDKGDPLGEMANFPKTARSRKSSRSNRSTASAPAKMTGDNRNSQLEFVVTGGRGLKKTPIQPQQIHANSDKTVTISVIPKTHVTFKSLTEEVVLKHKKLPARKSNSFEIADKLPVVTADMSLITPYFTYTKNREKSNSSLSERVLTWMNFTNLDVLDCKEDRLKPEIKKRAVTAYPSTNLPPKIDNYVGDRKYRLSSSPVSKISEEDLNEVTSTEEIVEDRKLIRSDPEENDYKLIKGEVTKGRYDFTKRQLHIFMPNVPKRSISDCSSIISGRSSSFLRCAK